GPGPAPVADLDRGRDAERLREDRSRIAYGLHDDPQQQRDPDGDGQPQEADEDEAQRVALRTGGGAAAAATATGGRRLLGEGVRLGGRGSRDQSGHVVVLRSVLDGVATHDPPQEQDQDRDHDQRDDRGSGGRPVRRDRLPGERGDIGVHGGGPAAGGRNARTARSAEDPDELEDLHRADRPQHGTRGEDLPGERHDHVLQALPGAAAGERGDLE